MTESKKECKFCSQEKMTSLNIKPIDHRAFQVYCGLFYYHGEDIWEEDLDMPGKEDFIISYKGEFKSVEKFCKQLFSYDYNYNNLDGSLKYNINWKGVWDNSVQYMHEFEQGYIFYTG